LYFLWKPSLRASSHLPRTGMDISSSTALTEPTAESVELSKTLAEMQSADADARDVVKVCIPWRSGSTATPTPPCLLQLRDVVSLRIWLSSSRTSMWRSRSFGQASLPRAVIVSS
jgi:hypothetical protein